MIAASRFAVAAVLASGLLASACVDERKPPPVDAKKPRTSEATSTEWMRRPAQKITLHVENVDVRKFADALSLRIGVRIIVRPDVRGRVSLRVVDTPWDQALANAIAPLGLRYDITRDGVVISYDRDRSGVILGQPPPGYFRVGGDVEPPAVIRRVEPVYPPEAKQARISGVVILEVLIDEEGRVRDTKVLKGLPYGIDEAARDAVRQWVFRPATVRGKPVKAVFNVLVKFDL